MAAHQNSKPYLVGIGGGSAAGKTELLHVLVKAFTADELTLISLDNYYKDFEHLSPDENGMINFDHPEAVDFQRFESHIKQLIDGEPVTQREYTFLNPALPVRQLTYHSAPLILIEGIFVFYLASLRELLNLKVYVDAEEEIRLSRRIRRDTTERALSLEYIAAQYEKQVVPMHSRFVEPYKQMADVVIMNNNNLERGAEVLINHLRQVLQHGNK